MIPQCPIEREIESLRCLYAAKFDYDLDRIVADLQRQGRESGEEFVTLPPRRPDGFENSPRESA